MSLPHMHFVSRSVNTRNANRELRSTEMSSKRTGIDTLKREECLQATTQGRPKLCSGNPHNEGSSWPRRTRGHSKEAEDDAGAGDLHTEGCTTRTMLINQSELASTEDVVHEGKHDADDDHKACLGKRSCPGKLASNSSIERQEACQKRGRFACFQHDKACK